MSPCRRPAFARLPAAALLAVLVLLAAGACAGRHARFRAAYAAAAAGRQGPELLAALVALDQEYPRELELKVNLGALCLAAGDLPGAAAYLERGERLAGAPRYAREQRLQYLLQGNLAELRLRSGRFPESAAHADRALARGGTDEIGVVFTRAKARLAAGSPEAALEDFAAGRAAGLAMNLEDYGAWARALAGAGRPAEALTALGERGRRFGYLAGQGLEESLLWERIGRPEEALLSAFLELERRRGGAGHSDAELTANLARLAERFRSEGEAGALRLLQGLESYLSGAWAEAQVLLGEAPGGAAAAGAAGQGEEPHLALEYLRLAAALEQGPTPADLACYSRLEPQLRALAAYYHHLWRGLRAAGGGYGFAAARPVLEKTILLAPDSAFAGESRQEIGRLLGLEGGQGAALLLAAEVQQAVRRATAEGRPQALEPVLAMLELPDTPYTAEALLALREALAAPLLRRQLELRAAAARGRLRERLEALLGR